MNISFTLILDNQSGTDLKLTSHDAFETFVTPPPDTLAAHTSASVVVESPQSDMMTSVNLLYEAGAGAMTAWGTGNTISAGVPTGIQAYFAGATSLGASGTMDSSSNPFSATVTITG